MTNSLLMVIFVILLIAGTTNGMKMVKSDERPFGEGMYAQRATLLRSPGSKRFDIFKRFDALGGNQFYDLYK